MERSKKIFVIGKKPTKLFVFAFAILPLCCSLLLIGFFTDYLKLGNYSIIFVTAIFLLLLFLFVPSIVRCRQYWSISEQYLELYAVTGYLQQLKYILNVFNGENDMFAFKIKLTEIKSIRLYWTTVWLIAATPMYPIYFGITLKDGSIITFESLVTSSSNEYIDAVKYLREKCNIPIEDKYNLLTALGDPSIRLAEYIYEIEKHRGIWGCKE